MADERNGKQRQATSGRVEQVTGVVVDVVFPDELPEIYSALKIDISPRRAGPR